MRCDNTHHYFRSMAHIPCAQNFHNKRRRPKISLDSWIVSKEEKFYLDMVFINFHKIINYSYFQYFQNKHVLLDKKKTKNDTFIPVHQLIYVLCYGSVNNIYYGIY